MIYVVCALTMAVAYEVTGSQLVEVGAFLAAFFGGSEIGRLTRPGARRRRLRQDTRLERVSRVLGLAGDRSS